MNIQMQLRETLGKAIEQLDADETKRIAEWAAIRDRGNEQNAQAIRFDKREKELANREAAVGQIRTIAAERLARIKVLEDGQAKLKKKADAAAAEARAAKLEKDRLEGVCATLLHEKNNLLAEELMVLDWAAADAHLKEVIGNYQSLEGTPGVNVRFALDHVLYPLRDRRLAGECAAELHAEMMGCQ